MWSPEEPKTSHTTNFVPCWHIVDGEVRAMQKNIWTLANIAPTMLQILRIQKPEIMTDSLGI
jgi:bisphosphoglycerate-independent phosphoglycerate mutase (AlkP superfamily)